MTASLVCATLWVILLIAPVSSLTCWECLAGCEDPLHHTEQVCREEEKHCLLIELEGERTLSCSPDPPPPGQEGCTEKAGELLRCFCDTDLCNGGNSLGGGGLGVGIVIITAMLYSNLV